PGWCVQWADRAQWARPAASDPGGVGQRRVVRRRRRRGGGTRDRHHVG
ncbi:polyketide synthase, partial [Mycobacterium tuberculosis]